MCHDFLKTAIAVNAAAETCIILSKTCFQCAEGWKQFQWLLQVTNFLSAYSRVVHFFIFLFSILAHFFPMFSTTLNSTVQKRYLGVAKNRQKLDVFTQKWPKRYKNPPKIINCLTPFFTIETPKENVYAELQVFPRPKLGGGISRC